MALPRSFKLGAACSVLLTTAAVVAPRQHASAAPAVISSTHYQLARRAALGGDGAWDYLTVDPVMRRLYITRGSRVDVVSLRTLAVVGHIANTPGVHGVAIDLALHRGFTTNGQDNTSTVFDTRTLREIGRVSVGKHPDGIVFDPISRRVFTLNNGDNTLTAIDARSMKVAGAIAVGGRPEAAETDLRGHVFIHAEDKGEVVEIDSQGLRVAKRWSVSPGDGPSGLTVDGKRGRVFSTCHNGLMIVSDIRTGRVIATPPIGRGPDAATFDVARRLAFSSNGQDGTISVIREVSPNVFANVQTVTTMNGARTMALDPVSHNIYLVTAKFVPGVRPAGVQRWRRKIVPGSFVLLVVRP